MTQNKIYPNEILTEIQGIAGEMNSLFKTQKNNLRTIAKFAGISVNSVKSVLAGETANIASYSLVAKALGTSLTNVVYNIKMRENMQTNDAAALMPSTK